MNCATGTSRFKQVLLDTTAHSKTIFSNPAKTFVALTAGGPSISKKLKQLLELEDDLNLRVRVIVNEIKQLRVRYIEFEGAEKKWPIEPVFCGNVHITLKVAQSKIKTARKILNKQIKIFNVLRSGGSNISKKLKPLIIKGKINLRISAVVNEIKQLRIDYIKFKGIEEDWPSEPVVGDVVHITLKEAQEKLNSVRKIYNKESRIFDALIIGEPIISTKLQPLFNLKGSEKFKQAIPAIVNEIKRLRTRYIELKGTKKNWPPEPVVGDVVYITLKEAQDKLKFIKTYNKQANVFDDLVADNPAPRFEDEDIIITREDNWKSKRLNIAINNIIDKINCLEKLYRHYSGIAKGANNDEWPENTVNTDDIVGDDYPTLKNAQTTVKSAKIVYDKWTSVFKKLTVDNPETTFDGVTTEVDINDNWNLKKLNAAITVITTEISRLKGLYRHYSGIAKGANNDEWPENTVNTDDIVGDDYPNLNAAQDRLSSIQATYKKTVNVFDALVVNNPEEFSSDKQSTIIRDPKWDLPTLNIKIAAITTEISRLEGLYRQYSGITKGATSDNWPINKVNTDNIEGNDFPTLKAAQYAITVAKSAYDQRTKVFDDLVAKNPTKDFKGRTTTIDKNEKWNLTQLNAEITKIVTQIKRLRTIYTGLGGSEKEWAVEPVNNNVIEISLKVAQTKLTDQINLIEVQKTIFSNLINGVPIMLKKDPAMPISPWPDDHVNDYPELNLVEAVDKVDEITTEINRLKGLYRHYSGIAKGANNDEWPENTVNTDDIVGDDYPTLKNAQTTVKSAKIVYDKWTSVFKKLTVDNPETTFDGVTTEVDINDNWNLKKLNAAITVITTEISRLKGLYRHYSGIAKGANNDEWPENTVNTDDIVGDDYPNLNAAQDRLSSIQATYKKTVNVFDALVVNNPEEFSSDKQSTIIRDPKWDLPTLNIKIAAITTEISRLEGLYRQYSGITKGATSDNWPINKVNTDNIEGNDFPTLKAAQKAVMLVKTPYDIQVNIFEKLIAARPLSSSEDKTIITLNSNWKLEELNEAISDIVDKIKRLRVLYLKRGGAENVWPAKPVVSRVILITLKDAENKLSGIQTTYTKRINVFKKLIAGPPLHSFKDKKITITLNSNWKLEELNEAISNITAEINHFRTLYLKLGGDESDWTSPPVTGNKVDFTLKNAQDKLSGIQTTYDERKEVFDDLVANKPAVNFKSKDIKIIRNKNWKLEELNNAISDIITEIKHLRRNYIDLGGLENTWVTEPVPGGVVALRLKSAQDKLSDIQTTYDERKEVFDDLVADKPAANFKSKDIKIIRNKNWKLEELNNAISDIITEIKHLRRNYIDLGGLENTWVTEPVPGGVVALRLKSAQDKLSDIQTTYDERKQVFDALIEGEPDPVFKDRTTTITLEKSWNVKDLNKAISNIIAEINRLRNFYIKLRGDGSDWTSSPVTGNKVNFTLKKAQDKLSVIQTTYDKRKEVFKALIRGRPIDNFEDRKTTTTLKKSWNVKDLNDAISNITAEINHFRTLYLKLGGDESDWTSPPVTGNKVDFTLKNAQDKLSNIQNTYGKRKKVFEDLTADSPESNFEDKEITIYRYETWTLEELNQAITAITNEISRLEDLYRKYSGIAKSADKSKWLAKTVNTKGTSENDFPTLKAAQNKVTTAKKLYKERVKVFNALIEGEPDTVFKDRTTTIILEKSWNLKELNGAISNIIAEITHLRELYIKREEIEDDWPRLPVVGNTVGFTLKKAQNKLNKIQATYSEQVKVFNALIEGEPDPVFKDRKTTITLEKSWNVKDLNKAISNIIDEINRLRNFYIKLRGDESGWTSPPVTGNKVNFTLKDAQDKLSDIQTTYDKRKEVFKALTRGRPIDNFKDRTTTITLEKSWNVKDLNDAISNITAEINHFRTLYLKLGGDESDWTSPPVTGNKVDFTLKNAQDKLSNIQNTYGKRKKVFEDLTADSPESNFEDKEITIYRYETWTLEELNQAITAITNEISRLEDLYRKYSGIAKSADKSKWLAKTVNTKGTSENDFPTLKAAQNKVTTAKKLYKERVNVFDALVVNNPEEFSSDKQSTIIRDPKWDLPTLNIKIAAITTEISRLEGLYRQYSGITKGATSDNWPINKVNTDNIEGNDFPTLKAAQYAITVAKSAYDQRTKVFDDLVAKNPTKDFKGRTTTIDKNEKWNLTQLNAEITKIVTQIKRLRTIYTGLGGSEKEWAVEPVNNNVIEISLKVAQTKLTDQINLIEVQKTIFSNLINGVPIMLKKDPAMPISPWPDDHVNDYPELNLVEAVDKVDEITTEINRLKGLYRHYSGIAKGTNNDEWPENTVNTDDNVGRDYPTLETAQTTVTSVKTIYDRKAKVFDALVVNNPEEILSDKQSTINRDDKWNLPTLNAKITTIIHEIKRLRVFYINLGGSKSVWNVEPVVGNTVNFTLKEAQNELNDIQATYRERVKVFNALIAGNPADNFEGKKTTITLEKSWNLEKLNEAISNIIAEITHLESLYHQYSGTIKGADNDEWPENDYLTLETAQTTVTSVKTTYDRRTKVFDDLIVDKPADTFEGETTIIVRVNTWNLEELNKAISDIITEIKRLEGLYRQYSETIKGVNNDEWPENTVNIDDTPKNDYPILKAVQNKVTTAKKLYKERAKVFDDLVAGKPVAIFEGRTMIIIRDDKWDLLTLNTKITAITTEITRLKEKFDDLKGDSNLWTGSLLENKPNLAEAQVLIKIAELKKLYGDYNLDSVPVSTDAFWANDEIITPDLFFTDKSPPMVTTVEVEKQIKSLQKEIKRTKITHLLLGGEAWTEEKTFVQVRKLTKNTVEIIKPDIQESANDMVKIDDIIKKYFSERGKTINKQTKAKLLQAILFQKVGVFSVNNDGMKWETIVAIFLGMFSIILVGIIFYFFKKPKIV